MGNKRESLHKAGESGKKILEWWKDVWLWSGDVIAWTGKAIFYTLKSAWEAWVARASESKSENPELSKEAKKKYKSKAQEYSKKSKESISEAWKSGKQALWWAWKVLKWWAKIVWNTAKAGYYLIDAWDKAIWEKIEKKQIEKWKKSPSKVWKFVRDNTIKLMIALWVAGYWWTEALQYITNDSNKPKQELIQGETMWDSTEATVVLTWNYNKLTGKKITKDAPLTRWYLWWDLWKEDLIVKDTLILNSWESLHNLRSEKIRKYGQSTKDINNLDTIDVKKMSPEEIENFRVKYPIDATYLFVVRPYTDWDEKKDKMNLQEFMKQSNEIIENVRKNTKSYDWWLTWNKKELFDVIRNGITWESIVAYAMTELCENKEDWEFNKQLFDLLLQNSWVNYLAKVPAIYDWKTSYWLYQFTEFALYNLPWDVRWASVVNRVVPDDEKIPWSVIDLKTWEDQTKAAYMFAIYNLNQAVKQLSDTQAKELLDYQKNNKKSFNEAITELIAMCHHMPVDKTALRERHKDKHKKNIYHYGKAQTYGKRTMNNYKALIK